MIRRFLSVGALAATLAGSGVAADDALPLADLESVMAQPHAYLKTKFRFEGRFDQMGQIYQPFFTMFNEFTHVNFAAWDASQDLSEFAEFTGSTRLLYVERREGEMMRSLLEMKKFQRFEAIASIESIFSDRAFVHVHALVPLDTMWTADQHVQAALGRLDAQGRPVAAKNEAREMRQAQPMPHAPTAVVEEDVAFDAELDEAEEMAADEHHEEPVVESVVESGHEDGPAPEPMPVETFEAEDDVVCEEPITHAPPAAAPEAPRAVVETEVKSKAAPSGMVLAAPGTNVVELPANAPALAPSRAERAEQEAKMGGSRPR